VYYGGGVVARLTVKPNATVNNSPVLLHLDAGAVACSTTNAGQTIFMTVGQHVDLTMDDPVWTVSVDASIILIRVYEGSVKIITNVDGVTKGSVTVGALQAVEVDDSTGAIVNLPFAKGNSGVEQSAVDAVRR